MRFPWQNTKVDTRRVERPKARPVKMTVRSWDSVSAVHSFHATYALSLDEARTVRDDLELAIQQEERRLALEYEMGKPYGS